MLHRSAVVSRHRVAYVAIRRRSPPGHGVSMRRLPSGPRDTAAPGGACVNLPAVLPAAAAASQLMTSPFATSPMGALTLAERLAGMPHRILNV